MLKNGISGLQKKKKKKKKNRELAIQIFWTKFAQKYVSGLNQKK